ncbi:M48 family metallopeptidase [Legionella oakridgensis]|uniref:Zinc metalloprotease n=2 Tax=Legionella oakridgensis TaxID=29423 RepID=A0A0W0XJI8_9GAMM|nr:SprT family zinc-dependent metalloprotease [Legionella oakridgensis]AHE66250.1 putative metal-dependent hydrolase [Legionella oakridgensis ATCC 33761 = DSM 21215]ETO93963.1 putative metal-dependent hydrolase [Legionella oakridgensis RV-2-2007]KTD44758.1 zinc metalloprotease [Legionella oakridgensis]STY16148.1 metal-dependent hydrolase [Legionella longbeachae]
MMIAMDGYFVELTRKPIKNINLRIDTKGQVKISVPIRYTDAEVYHFLQSKHEWINHHRKRLQAFKAPAIPQWITGERHFFLGKAYELQMYSDSEQTTILQDEHFIHCYVQSGATIAEKRLLLKTWYRQQMKSKLPTLLKKWEPIIDVQVSAWRIKSMKTRWGSCNTREKRIWLNACLIQKPLECLEYVLVHEMVHLLEASHNKRFHKLMSTFMPEWPIYKKRLSESPAIFY